MSKEDIVAKYIWSSDPETKKSTSAGAFYLIAKQFLKTYEGNVAVYGCAFDEENTAKHVRIVTIDDLAKLQGSKYVQSDTSEIFKKILTDLKNGYYVLFSGTACQTAAVYKYARGYEIKLYTIDVLCHGVPSPKLWRQYLQALQKKENKKITSIRFRNKSITNRLGYILKYTTERHERTVFPSESEYYSAFISSQSLRPSCYICPFVGYYGGSDLTLGDSNHMLFHPNEAISLVIIRTKKGGLLLDSILEICEVVDAKIEEESKINRKLLEAAKKPDNRDQYYSSLLDNELVRRPALSLYVKNRILNSIPTSIKNCLKRWIRIK